MTTPCLEVAVWRKKKENECIIRVFKNKASKQTGRVTHFLRSTVNHLAEWLGLGMKWFSSIVLKDEACPGDAHRRWQEGKGKLALD